MALQIYFIRGLWSLKSDENRVTPWLFWRESCPSNSRCKFGKEGWIVGRGVIFEEFMEEIIGVRIILIIVPQIFNQFFKKIFISAFHESCDQLFGKFVSSKKLKGPCTFDDLSPFENAQRIKMKARNDCHLTEKYDNLTVSKKNHSGIWILPSVFDKRKSSKMTEN